jgi:hypothetical protein
MEWIALRQAAAIEFEDWKEEVIRKMRDPPFKEPNQIQPPI